MPDKYLKILGKIPQVAAEAFVAPGARVIGDVEIGPGSSVWFGCVVRGDVCHVCIGAGSNLQDGSIVHVARAGVPTLIGDRVTVGHGCILHACTIEDEGVIGMGSLVMDGVVVEPGAVLGAGSLLTPGKRVPAGELWLGRPAVRLRAVTSEEAEGWRVRARDYVDLARVYREGGLA